MEIFSYAYVMKNKCEIAIFYLFGGVLGLPCCAWALSSCVQLLLIVVVSHVAEHRL